MSNIFNNDDVKILDAALKKHNEEEELKARIIEEYEREKALDEAEEIEEVVEEPKERVKVVEVDESLEAEKKAERGRKITKAVNITLLATAVLLACGLSFMGIRKLLKLKEEKDFEEAKKNANIVTVTVIDEDEEENVKDEDATVSIGGSFVDNHNQELFISSKKDLEEVDKNNTINDENNKKEETKKSTTKTTNKTNTTATTTTTNTNTNVLPDNSLVITYDSNTNQYIVDSGNNDQGIGEPIYEDPYTQDPPDPPVDPQPEPTEDNPPVVEEKYEGYVLRKSNFAKDGFWYTPYFSGNEIKVDSVDMSMVGDGQLDPHNSNIYALSMSKDVAGWEYIRDNNKDDQFLDSVSNLDAVINSLIAEQERFRREQDNNQVSPQQDEFIFEEEPVVLQLRTRKIGR